MKVGYITTMSFANNKIKKTNKLDFFSYAYTFNAKYFNLLKNGNETSLVF